MVEEKDPFPSPVANNLARGRKFRIAATSLAIATVYAAAMETAAFWLVVETILPPGTWAEIAEGILWWWGAVDALIVGLYGGANVAAKFADRSGA